MSNIINHEQININMEKIDLYLREEKIYFDKIKQEFDLIKNLYITDNSNIFEEKNIEIMNKMNKIQKIHFNDLEVLKNNIYKYRNIAQKNASIFDNITR